MDTGVHSSFDIRQNGLHKPIILYEDKILDGRNRFLACKKLWPEYTPDKKYEHYEGDDPLGYVLSLNLHRRHLTASQRAALAAEIANLDLGRPEKNSAKLQSLSQPIIFVCLCQVVPLPLPMTPILTNPLR